ncbi:hypothetical protein [Anaerotignum sp.]
MNMFLCFLWEHLDSIVTAFGLIVAVKIVTKEYRNGLKLQQNEFMCNKLGDITEKIDKCNKAIMAKNVNELTVNLNSLEATILSYGTVDAINILEKTIVASRIWDENKDGSYDLYMVAHLFLLATQLKKDLTGVEISPEKMFVILTNDYENHKPLLKKYINKTVDECNLSEKFKL